MVILNFANCLFFAFLCKVFAKSIVQRSFGECDIKSRELCVVYGKANVGRFKVTRLSLPKVATYDLQPEMSAYLVTDKVLEELDRGEFDVVILNFANCDMVGHTGVIPAAVKAVGTVDECVKKVTDKILEMGGAALLTADHGNADKLF